jgi:hypothetical protein
MESQYNVQSGVSWGSLPLNLQLVWREKECDFLLIDELTPPGITESLVAFEDETGRCDIIRNVDQRNNTTTSKFSISLLLMNINIKSLKVFITMIDEMIVDKGHADITLFHEEFPSRIDMATLRSHTKRRITFINIASCTKRVHFKILDVYNHEPVFQKRSKWGYANMIRFWFYDIFLILNKYSYIMRLDDDSQLLKPCKKVWKYLETNKIVYLGNTIQDDDMVVNLTTTAHAYVDTYKIIPSSLIMWTQSFQKPGRIRQYYNNFEITHVPFFLSKSVMHWNKAIMTSEGIHRYRWGDHVLRYLTLALFAKESQIRTRKDVGIEYCHPAPCTKSQEQDGEFS